MENQEVSIDELPMNQLVELRLEEDEDEFRSCCGDEEVWRKESDDMVKAAEEKKEELDEFSVKMFFKGVSISQGGDSSVEYSGIGVVLERSADFPTIQVQKKLDFYVEESVANYLALMDGLAVALQNNLRRVFAVTDSESLHDQIMNGEKLEHPLLIALRERILEHTSNLENFVLNLVPSGDLECPLILARVAIGIVSPSVDGDNKSLEHCTICCDDRPTWMMITMKCTHRFCSHCMKRYVYGKVKSSRVPIRCPQPRCKYNISAVESKSFLPVASYELFSRALEEANAQKSSDKIYCPYPNCSILLDPLDCLSGRASSSSQAEYSCVECPVCERFVCVDCGVPWHSSMSCEEFQNIPIEERDAADITLHRLARNKRWRRCQECRRMIELTHGCYHMTCWCGHEFCYSCGAEYRNGRQTCLCAFWDEDQENSDDDDDDCSFSHSIQESEQWAWETFNSLPMIMDAYSDQERSQLALIQRFLAGGFSLSDHQPYQSPPRCSTESSYVEAAMKDLHQLPWLERFVSVINDNYYEEYSQ